MSIYDNYFEDKIKITDYEIIKKRIHGRKVYIWGADNKGTNIHKWMGVNDIHVEGFLDAHANELEMDECCVLFPDEIIREGNSKEYFIVLSMYLKHEKEVIKKLSEAGFENKDYWYPAMDWKFMLEETPIIDEYWLNSKLFLANRIMETLPQDVFYILLWGGHIGDEAIALSWLGAFKREKCINKLVILTSKTYAGMARLYAEDINEIKIMDKNELDALKVYTMSNNRKYMNICGAGWHWMPKNRGVPFPIAQTLFKTMQLGLNYTTKSKRINGWGYSNFEVKKLIKEYGILKDKSLILIPYAKTAEEIPMTFWNRIIEKFSSIYQIYTNVAGNEIPIEGTKSITVSLEYIVDIVKYAGAAISVRCGLTDLLALGECNCQVVYMATTPEELNYAQVTSLYVDGQDSILYKNANFIKSEEDLDIIVDNLYNYFVEGLSDDKG